MRKIVLSHESWVARLVIITTLLLIGFYLVRVGTNFVVYAQSCPNNNLSSGLVTALSTIQGLGNLQSICATGSGVHIDLRDATYNVETYENIFNNYFNGSGASITKVKIENQPDYRINTDSYQLFHINSDLNINGTSISGSEPASPTLKPTMVFVAGNLNLLADINYGNNKSNIGIVFIVRGKINIDAGVTRVNAVLVAQGEHVEGVGIVRVHDSVRHTICTSCYTDRSSGNYARNNSRHALNPTQFDETLIIQGNLVSLKSLKVGEENQSIAFYRERENNDTPAEIINGQVKYMIILKDLITQPFQRFVEL